MFQNKFENLIIVSFFYVEYLLLVSPWHAHLTFSICNRMGPRAIKD